MTLNIASSPWLSRFSPPIFTKLPEYSPNNSNSTSTSNATLLFLLLRTNSLSSLKTNKPFKPRASLKNTQSNGVLEGEETSVLNEELLSRVSATKDADEALEMIDQSQSESSEQRYGGVVSGSDCRLIISAALDRNNADLALSVFYAMRSSFDTGLLFSFFLFNLKTRKTLSFCSSYRMFLVIGVSENGPLVDRWKWSRPNVGIYTTLVQGLAVSLRVSDALRMIDDICRIGVSPGEEV